MSKIEVHHTPKHASWLNAAEIEINVMDIECTGDRIGSKEILAREVAAWTARRNDQKKKINWKFTREKADRKLSKYYVPKLNGHNTSYFVHRGFYFLRTYQK